MCEEIVWTVRDVGLREQPSSFKRDLRTKQSFKQTLPRKIIFLHLTPMERNLSQTKGPFFFWKKAVSCFQDCKFPSKPWRKPWRLKTTPRRNQSSGKVLVRCLQPESRATESGSNYSGWSSCSPDASTRSCKYLWRVLQLCSCLLQPEAARCQEAGHRVGSL